MEQSLHNGLHPRKGENAAIFIKLTSSSHELSCLSGLPTGDVHTSPGRHKFASNLLPSLGITRAGDARRGAYAALGLPELPSVEVLALHIHPGNAVHLGSVTLTSGSWIRLVAPTCWQAVGAALQTFWDSTHHHRVTGAFCIYPHKAGNLVSLSAKLPKV